MGEKGRNGRNALRLLLSLDRSAVTSPKCTCTFQQGRSSTSQFWALLVAVLPTLSSPSDLSRSPTLLYSSVLGLQPNCSQATSKGRRSSACVCLSRAARSSRPRPLLPQRPSPANSQPSTTMTHPQPSPPSSVEAEQDLLDRLLREAFKPSSPEFESYTHVRPTLPLSPRSHTCVPSRSLN